MQRGEAGSKTILAAGLMSCHSRRMVNSNPLSARRSLGYILSFLNPEDSCLYKMDSKSFQRPIGASAMGQVPFGSSYRGTGNHYILRLGFSVHLVLNSSSFQCLPAALPQGMCTALLPPLPHPVPLADITNRSQSPFLLSLRLLYDYRKPQKIKTY